MTFLLKLLFYPLSEASGKSMARMKTLAPRLKNLQETVQGRSREARPATMEMYRKEKVNPLAGCLPMLIQIPVFLAFYWVLLESVEMRQAPFLGWINDLSARDPFFILPVIMAGAMFVQFKLNPQMGDPVQQKIIMIMPLVMSVTFAFFPSGLVLYWVTNTDPVDPAAVEHQPPHRRCRPRRRAAERDRRGRHHRRRRHAAGARRHRHRARLGPLVPQVARALLGALPAPRTAAAAPVPRCRGRRDRHRPRAVFPGAAFLYRRRRCWNCRAMADPWCSKRCSARASGAGLPARAARANSRSAPILNGKLDLAQAEAVADLIDAASAAGRARGPALAAGRVLARACMRWSRR